jgi:multidrug resistance efflux pump
MPYFFVESSSVVMKMMVHSARVISRVPFRACHEARASASWHWSWVGVQVVDNVMSGHYNVSPMATPFSRSIRALTSERSNTRITSLAAIGLLVLLMIWGSWAALAKVTLWQSGVGRVESIYSAHVVGAPSSGRVETVAADLGRKVRSGEILVELEADDIQARHRQMVVRHDTLVTQLEAIEVEIEASVALVDAIAQGSMFAIAEARAESQRAAEEARWAREQASRLERLVATSSVSKEAEGQASAEAEAWKSGARAAAFATKRVAGEAHTREADATVNLQRLRRERASLRGQRDSVLTEIEQHNDELSRRRVTAPIDGVIGERTDIRPGAVVLEGQQMLSIVPEGPLRVIAEFPSAALGRLQPGQVARMRLRGFPWTRFGMVELRVAQVGTEVRAGYLRVELDIERTPDGVPLAHALQGTIEVAVEEVTPLEVLLRSVGQVFCEPCESDEVSPDAFVLRDVDSAAGAR